MTNQTNERTHSNFPAWGIATLMACLVFVPFWGSAQTIPDNTSTDFVIDSSSRKADRTGDTTDGSAVVTVGDTSPLAAGDAISGPGIPQGASILTVDSGTQITISSNATSTGSGITLNVAPPAVLTTTPVNDINSIEITDTIHRIIDIGAGNTLRVGETGSIRRTTTSNQDVTVSGGTLTAGGADNTDGNLLLRSAGTNGEGEPGRTSLYIDADITDNGTGTVSVSKSGDYITELSGTNTYTGTTTVTEGYLRVSGPDNLGAGAITVQGTGGDDDGGVHLNGAGVYNNDFFISGNGSDFYKSNRDQRGAIWLGDGVEVAGTVTLTGDTQITMVSGNSAEISGQITGGHALQFGNHDNHTAQGMVTLSNPNNDWTGDTTLRVYASSSRTVTLRLGAGEVIPHGPGKGNLSMVITGGSSGTRGTLDLNGFSETINGLDSTVPDSIRHRVRSDAAGEVTFTVGAGDADGDFEGRIEDGSGTLNFTKTGTGTQILKGGAHSYTGATVVEGGTLDMQGTLTGTSGVTVQNGGAFLYSNANALDRDVTLNNGTFQHTSSADYAGTLTFTSGTVGGTNLGGTLDGLTIGTGQTVAPGTSVGEASTGSQTWAPGGSFEFEISFPTDDPNFIDWDHLAVSGDLDISGLNTSDPFIIDLVSLTFADEPGELAGFDPDEQYAWEFVSYGSLTGVFSGDLFQVDSSNFQNPTSGDMEFQVTQSGSSLFVSQVPEPSILLLLMVAVGALFFNIRRRRA